MAIEKIKGIIKELLQKMSVSFEDVEVSTDSQGNSLLSIKTKEAEILIGDKGEGFLALSHIVKKITSQTIGEEVLLSLDVNNYQARNLQKLREKALVFAERARSFKTSVSMDPMSSYERMIVHSLFVDSKDIETRSEGLGGARHVVISYREKTIL